MYGAISEHAIGQFMRSRCSVRQYSPKPVSEEMVTKMVDAANQAPSSCNRHTLKIFSTTNQERAREILPLFVGYTGFNSNVQCALVFCADLRPYSFPQEIFIPTLDTGLAIENAALMAHALGLSMTILSWGNRTTPNELKLRRILGLPEYYEIIAGAACGHPSLVCELPARKSVEETLVRIV